VKDGNREHITREPEQVKAFRDTWRDGIHSYLTYLRDRLTGARDLLAESGSCLTIRSLLRGLRNGTSAWKTTPSGRIHDPEFSPTRRPG
jgi:hypothetical protein